MSDVNPVNYCIDNKIFTLEPKKKCVKRSCSNISTRKITEINVNCAPLFFLLVFSLLVQLGYVSSCLSGPGSFNPLPALEYSSQRAIFVFCQIVMFFLFGTVPWVCFSSYIKDKILH